MLVIYEFYKETFIENFIDLYEFATKNKSNFQNYGESPLDKIKKLFRYNKEIVKLIDKTFGEESVLKIFGTKSTLLKALKNLRTQIIMRRRTF